MTEFGNGKESGYVDGVNPHLPTLQQAFSCDQCRRLSLGSYWGNTPSGSTSESIMEVFWRKNAPQRWSPDFVQGQNFADVPQHIAAAASEAHKSASIGNRMSAILMARTVIEATAKDKGIAKGNLRDKIDAMRAKDFVREHIKDSAHEIRHFGNDMAHGDIDKPIDDDDVTEVLVLMDEVLDEVYQSLARLAKVKAARAARNQVSEAGA